MSRFSLCSELLLRVLCDNQFSKLFSVSSIIVGLLSAKFFSVGFRQYSTRIWLNSFVFTPNLIKNVLVRWAMLFMEKVSILPFEMELILSLNSLLFSFSCLRLDECFVCSCAMVLIFILSLGLPSEIQAEK